MEKKKMGLPMQIFLALILGIVVGLVLYFAGAAEFTTSYLKPFGDISSADLARNIPGSVYCSTLDKVTAQLRELARPGDLILTVGAGDIYRAGEKLLSETED